MEPSIRRTRRRRLLAIPAALTALLLGLAAAAWVRGTWAADWPAEPQLGEAPVAGVVRTPEGGREVRAAARVPFALEEVWAVVTDYDNYGDLCNCLRADQIMYEADGNCRIEGQARSGLPATIPFRAEMRHERRLDRYLALWDEAAGRVVVNRGRWELTPAGRRETVVAVSLEVQVRGVPAFILRNLSLGRLPDLLGRLEHRLRTGGPGRKWTDGS
jgi:hypothetical protein